MIYTSKQAIADLGKHLEGTLLCPTRLNQLKAESFETMSDEFKRDLVQREDPTLWEVLDPGAAPGMTARSEKAAYIRGELEAPCSCEGDQPRVHLRHRSSDVHVEIRDKQNPHILCRYRKVYLGKSVRPPAWLSPVHRDHRVLRMKPFEKSPISIEGQQKVIDGLPTLVEHLVDCEQRGWVMFGPPGSSKTSYVTAVLGDVLIGRMMIDHLRALNPAMKLSDYHRTVAEDRTFGIWRVRVSGWLAEVQAFETRDFAKDIPEPDVTIEKIRIESRLTGLPPIVWLEEIDRFKETDARRNHLFRLIDTVYEMRGCVIVTTNAKPNELKELLDEATYRRIVGDNDDGKFTTWDLHTWATKAPPSSRNAPRPC